MVRENKETESVINFLVANSGLVQEYFKSVEPCQISYSGLMSSGLVSGTTEEGINFKSTKIKRSTVTEFLHGLYSEEVLSEL